jgi:hypothetical protein
LTARNNKKSQLTLAFFITVRILSSMQLNRRLHYPNTLPALHCEAQPVI